MDAVPALFVVDEADETNPTDAVGGWVDPDADLVKAPLCVPDLVLREAEDLTPPSLHPLFVQDVGSLKFELREKGRVEGGVKL